MRLALVLGLLPWGAAAFSSSQESPRFAAQSLQGDDAWRSEGDLIAFLREGDVWLMELDGSNQRQLTFQDQQVRRFSWSPSGRYLLVAHGGPFWYPDGSSTDSPFVASIVDLATETTTELLELDISMGTEAWRFPTWAQDADALMLVVAGDFGQRTLTRIHLDGTTMPVATYEVRPTCGGPDGPFSLFRDLHWGLELGSVMLHDIYPVVFWWDGGDLALVNEECSTGYLVDLATGQSTSYAQTSWVDVQGNLALVSSGLLASGDQVGLFDLQSRTTVALPSGLHPTFGDDGSVFLLTEAETGASAFVSPFEEFSFSYADRNISFWRTDTGSSAPVALATIAAYGTSVPSVSHEGAFLVVGAIDNPTEMIATDTSAYASYSPWAYSDHLRTFRVDTSTGEILELATNAYRPLVQPALDVASNDHITPTEEPTSTERAGSGPESVEPNVRIAYLGADGNIWLISPDGTGAMQVTTDGVVESGLSTYGAPAWSHDGSTLAFAGGFQGSPIGVMLYRDGAHTPVPGTEGCRSPAFSADDQRLLFACDVLAGYEIPADLGSNPKLAFVSSSNPDGSDLRVDVPYSTDGTGIAWGDGKSIHYANNINVNPGDGSFIVTYHGFHKSGLHQFNATGALIGSFELPGDGGAGLGPTWASFLPDGQRLVATWCSSGCLPQAGNMPVYEVVVLDLQGAVLERWTSMSFPDNYYWGIDSSPDGSQVVTSFEPAASDIATLRVFDGPDSYVEIGSGTYPAWQPGSGASSNNAGAPNVATGDTNDATVTDEPVRGSDPIVAGGDRSGSDLESTSDQVSTVTTSPDRDPALEGGNLSTADSTAFTDVHICSEMANDLVAIPRPLNPPPADCVAVGGAVIDIAGPGGEVIGWCTTGETGGCSAAAPSRVELTLILDMTTVPAGYIPHENPRTITLPDGIWDGIIVGFVLVPAG